MMRNRSDVSPTADHCLSYVAATAPVSRGGEPAPTRFAHALKGKERQAGASKRQASDAFVAVATTRRRHVICP